MYTVVVADDEEELRRALIRRVDWEGAGFCVVGEAENGIEALELVEKLEPDLLLTDVRMPFISGIELARQVREIRPNLQIAFLSGFDDFSYAQQAIQYNIVSYMLKPISAAELTKELKQIKEKIDEKFEEFSSQSVTQEKLELSEFLIPLLLDGFQGEIGDQKNQSLMETAVSCGLLRDVNVEFGYTVMVTSFIDKDGNNCTARASVNAIDIILRKYIKHFSFYIEGKVVSLLTASQAGFDKYLHILVEDIVQSVRRIMNLSCSIGVSRPVWRISGCHEAYVEAMNAISYSRRLESGVHFISDEERTDDSAHDLLQNALSEVENLIRGGSKQELESFLQNLFAQMEEKRISSAVMNFMMVQMVATVFRIVYAVADKESVQELQKNSPLQCMMLFEEFTEVKERYISLCLSAKEMISDQRKKSSTILCDKALELINARYMEQEISLVSVSTEIAVSPNYLSALIKKSTGSTFIDLLTKKRIETAKELLLCTNMKVREISEKCGYKDQHYFSYCFKKIMGISPNNCRRLNEEKER